MPDFPVIANFLLQPMQDRRTPMTRSSRFPAPRSISWACKLLLLSLAFTVISLAPSISGRWWASPDPGVPDTMAFLFGMSFVVVQLALLALLIYLTYTRRNWARWALLVFLMLGWVYLVQNFHSLQSSHPMEALWDAGGMILELLSCIILFFSRDAAWFIHNGSRR